jgi:hypothetical protein
MPNKTAALVAFKSSLKSWERTIHHIAYPPLEIKAPHVEDNYAYFNDPDEPTTPTAFTPSLKNTSVVVIWRLFPAHLPQAEEFNKAALQVLTRRRRIYQYAQSPWSATTYVRQQGASRKTNKGPHWAYYLNDRFIQGDFVRIWLPSNVSYKDDVQRLLRYYCYSYEPWPQPRRFKTHSSLYANKESLTGIIYGWVSGITIVFLVVVLICNTVVVTINHM